MAYIPPVMRRRVARAARYQCGYCQTQEAVIGMPLEIDHIVPESAGGSSDEANLWLACPRCNRYKGAQTHAFDEDTENEFPFLIPIANNGQTIFLGNKAGFSL